MLTERMQIQVIADRLAGFPANADPRFMNQPWLTCWNAIVTAESGKEHEALHKATSNLPEQKEILQKILSTRPGFTPVIPSLKDIADDLPPIEWVWKCWIPRGLLTVLGASQGSGKSFLVTDLAYRIIHNKGFPDGSLIVRPGANVIYVDAESVPQILKERTDHYGMDQSKMYVMLADPGEMIDLSTQKYQDRLTEMAATLKPELIIIDSLSSAHSRGQNNVEDLRSLVMYLVQLAAWANCGLVLVHHIRKPPSGGGRMMSFDAGMEDLSGSGYITQQARVVIGLRVVQTGPDFDPNGPREFKVLKSNLGAYPKALGFTFEPLSSDGARLQWDRTAPQDYQKPTKLDECKEWLEDLLRSHPEGIKVNEVIEAGAERKFTRSMIYQAQSELSANIENTLGRKAKGNAWIWKDASEESDESQESDESDSFSEWEGGTLKNDQTPRTHRTRPTLKA